MNGTSMHGIYSPEELLSVKLGDAVNHHTVLSMLFLTRDADRSVWQLDRLQEVLRQVGKGSRCNRCGQRQH